MIRYSVQPTERIFVKVYAFLSLAKKMGRKIRKTISKILINKYSQKILDHTKQSATDALKTASKRAIQTTAEATCDLIGNKIADSISKVSKTSSQISLEKITNKHDKEIPKERYI